MITKVFLPMLEDAQGVTLPLTSGHSCGYLSFSVYPVHEPTGSVTPPCSPRNAYKKRTGTSTLHLWKESPRTKLCMRLLSKTRTSLDWTLFSLRSKARGTSPAFILLQLRGDCVGNFWLEHVIFACDNVLHQAVCCLIDVYILLKRK